jgi:glycosyltransferase involved in cell wall biosynthesis
MKDSPDIIHTIGIRSFQSFIAAIIAKKKKIPLVISDQGGLTTHPDLDSGGVFKKILYKLQTPMIRFIVNNSTKISVANEYEKEIFAKIQPTSKIEVVRNGINLAMMKTKTNNFKKKHGIPLPFVLFIGRFSKIKGIDILLHAIKILKDEPDLKNISFVIMGVDFGFQNQMMQMIDDFGIKEKIHVITNPSRDDVIAAYGESEFLVLPSRWELSPLTPLEGFAFKKTVISSDIHGIPYTLSKDENCILVEVENYKELANSIIELIVNKEKRTRLGISGYNIVNSELNSKTMVKKTLKIYETIVHNYQLGKEK